MTKRKINILGRILQIFLALMVLGIAPLLAFNPFLSLFHKHPFIFAILTAILIWLCYICFKSGRERDIGLDLLGAVIALFLLATAGVILTEHFSDLSSLFKK